MLGTDIGKNVVIHRTRAENAAHVINRVRSLGIEPNGSCRLMEMLRSLQQGDIPYGHPNFWTALESDRDMQILAFILDQENARSDNPGFVAKIETLLHDSVLPQDDRGESKGRNAQFELYLGAVCENARLTPVLFEEPDVTCVVGGIKFAIAAKRIKHEQQLRKRVRAAAAQIERTQLPGIIAIDAMLALNDTNRPIVSPIEYRMLALTIPAVATSLMQPQKRDIEKSVKGKGVRGILICHSVLCTPPGEGWILQGMSIWHPTADGSFSARKEGDLFFSRFRDGLPNCEELS